MAFDRRRMRFYTLEQLQTIDDYKTGKKQYPKLTSRGIGVLMATVLGMSAASSFGARPVKKHRNE